MAKSKANLFENESAKNLQEGDIIPPAEVAESKKEDVVNSSADDDIQDIDLSVIKKKRFRINGEKDKILELNTSDLGIATRLDVAYKRLNALMDEVGANLAQIPDDATEEEAEEHFDKIKNTLENLDKQMREQVDYIFNSNVSELCAADGSMWDPISGAFRFEHIIDTITKLYENNLNDEFAKMKARVNRKVATFTKKKH